MAPGTDWKEVIPHGEAELLERLALELRDMQRHNARGGRAGRALHAKGQLAARAELRVLPDLPAYARVGPFASPATYRAYVRFSNGGGRRQPDRKPDVRGVAIKVLGVAGKKVIPALADATTQDFLLIHTPTMSFRSAEDFVWLVRAASSPATLPFRVIGRFGLVRGVRLLRATLKQLGAPFASLATVRYHSALPIRFGDYAVKLALTPRTRPDPQAKRGGSPDYLGEELAARLAREAVVYDFQVQFYVDEARTPIEDASKEWREEDAPFVTLAELTLPRQDVGSEEGRRFAAWVETLSFDPWHALEELRPLGHMMRARNAAYRVSTKERGAAPEPDGSEGF